MHLEAINKIIKDFDLYLYRNNGRFVGVCPIHEGADNPTAFNININSGHFFCNTAGCHNKVHNNDLFGFVHALMSSRSVDFENGQLCNIDLVQDYLDNNKLDIVYNNDHREIEEEKPIPVEYDLDLDYLDKYDLGNCAFFINRGYKRYILEKHAVFTCPDPNKEFYHLCIAPIFNIPKTKIIGVTARMPYDKCLVCDGYHNPQELCSSILDVTFNSKWRHYPRGFIKTNYLYNLWNSWRYIKLFQSIIIVESPGNVWALEQAGFYNSVALLGSTISSEQRKLIDKLNPRDIYIIGDNDTAGNKMTESIQEWYPSSQTIDIGNVNDLAELEEKELQGIIWKKLL